MQLTTEWMTSAAQLIDFRELVKPGISAWASSSLSSGEWCVAGRLVTESAPGSPSRRAEPVTGLQVSPPIRSGRGRNGPDRNDLSSRS
jgi:hypothetical protein